MSNTWFSALTSGSPARNTDVIAIARSGANYKLAASDLIGGVLIATGCTGGDIGAQVNAAITALGSQGGTVFIPAGSYTQTTTIVKPQNVCIVGAGTVATILNYTGSGWAVVIGSATGGMGGVSDLSLIGPMVFTSGGSSTTGGIYLGGTDSVSGSPSSGDVGTNSAFSQNIERVCVKTFGTGIQWGENAWCTTIYASQIVANGIGLYFPGSLPNSGERIAIIGCSVYNNIGIGLKIASGTSDTDFHIVDTSFDYNGYFTADNAWAIQNGGALLSLTGCHVEQLGHWLQNLGYGICTLTGCLFTNGSVSATLGWLIDNQNIYGLTVSGGSFTNSGSGALNNTGVTGGVWIGVSANVTINNALAVYDRYGTATLSSVIAGTLQSSGNLGVNGATPAAATTGYGTPTGNAITSSFAASTITLGNLAAEVAQLVLDLKKAGIIKA